MMLLCCWFASASFTSRNPSSLSVDCLDSNIYMICRTSLIATPSGRLSQKRFTKKDSGSRLYSGSWLFSTGIVTSISCAFSVRSSLLQILRNSSCRHRVVMLLSLSSVTHLTLSLAFVQRACNYTGVSRWSVCVALFLLNRYWGIVTVPGSFLKAVVGNRICCSHSFTAYTVDVTVHFIYQTVSALASVLSRYFAQPTPCWLHLAYFGQKTGCWHISCHHHPQLSPSLLWSFFVTQIPPQHEPSCILSQHIVYYPCTVERLVDASPFFLLLDTSLFETLLIHPCTML